MVSIIISAYNSSEFIEQCLDSFMDQDYQKFEILLGIDADQELVNKMSEIHSRYKNLRVFLMKENVGTYVTFNTLLKYAKGNRILRFDSDDIPKENLLSTIIKYDTDVVQFKFEEINEGGDPGNLPGEKYPDGVVLVKKSIFKKYGAYRPWRITSDTEFLRRLKGIISIHKINSPLFYRRVHPNSLTQLPETKQGSSLRASLTKIIYKDKLEPKIETTVTECQELFFKDETPTLVPYLYEELQKYQSKIISYENQQEKLDEELEKFKQETYDEIENLKEQNEDLKSKLDFKPTSNYEEEYKRYSVLSPRDKEIQEEKHYLKQILNMLIMIYEKDNSVKIKKTSPINL